MELRVVGSGSKGNCYLLKERGQYLALDAGCKFKDVQVACDFAISNVLGCLVTHGHADHCKYAPQFAESAIGLYTGENAAMNIAKATGCTPIALRNKRYCYIGDWQVLPFEVPHEDEPNYGYVIESPDGHKILYLTDFQYTKYTFRTMHLNTMLIACNHMDDTKEFEGENHFAHIVSGHSSLSVTKLCIQANYTKDLRNVVLCHLSERNADADEMQRVIQETVGNKVTVEIAKKGLVVE